MDGCASIYPAISAIFVAQIFGIHLSLTDYLLIAFVSVVGSAATAGPDRRGRHADADAVDARPAAGRRRLLLAIDPILDMGRTAVNVAGQALVPTIVAKREGILDLEQYDSASAEDLFSDDVEPDVEQAERREPVAVSELVGAGPMSPAVVAGMYPRRPVRASAAVAAPSTTADGSAS